MFVLIIVAMVHNGHHVTTQEFDSIDACTAAKIWVVDQAHDNGRRIAAECIEKDM